MRASCFLQSVCWAEEVRAVQAKIVGGNDQISTFVMDEAAVLRDSLRLFGGTVVFIEIMEVLMDRQSLRTNGPKGLNNIFDRNANLNTEISIPIPAGYALKRLSEIKRKTLRSRNILVDQKQVQNPSGPTKTWEIELSLFRVDNRFGKMSLGRHIKGLFSCHRIGTFTTYAVNVAGREYWFDQLDLAINSLVNRKIWKY